MLIPLMLGFESPVLQKEGNNKDFHHLEHETVQDVSILHDTTTHQPSKMLMIGERKCTYRNIQEVVHACTFSTNENENLLKMPKNCKWKQMTQEVLKINCVTYKQGFMKRSWTWLNDFNDNERTKTNLYYTRDWLITVKFCNYDYT